MRSLWIISSLEAERLFRTRRGAFYLFTFALLWFFLLRYPILAAASAVAESRSSESGALLFDMLGLGPLMLWPVPEFAVYWRFALYLFPLLAIIFTADQTASDRERGTLRFLTLRCSRDAIFFGRFAGMMLIQSALLALTLLTTLVMVIWRDDALLWLAINSAAAVAISLFLILLPFTALMALLSQQLRSSGQAALLALLVWSLMPAIINGLSNVWQPLSFVQHLIPGVQLPELAKLVEWQTLKLAYIPLLQTLLLLALGRTLFLRRAL
jgi:ABC-type transport system involved in multi-copper enzyme maturation permease subunit